jgi:thymidylate synthase
MRHDYLHVVYYIRSCDFTRHWSDDCYLTIRLALWLLDRLRERDKRWYDVRVGMFTMHITSLHVFINDWQKMKEEAK